MKFEEALALMREGKIAVDPGGQEVTLENGKFMRSTYIGSPPIKGCVTQFSDKYILEEWTIKEEPKFQYLWRDKGLCISDGVKIWEGVTGRCSSEEEALKSFLHPERIELRRIEP